MVGRTLGHYRLLEQVGQGGMAAVYRARDLSLDRDCAVKVLHRHLQSERESRLRFQREAQAVARLRHPNILEIYAYSVDEADESFLVTEFIAGPTLRSQILAHPPRFPEIAAMIGCEVARALAVAHRQGVVHRDIKPENIMVRGEGSGDLNAHGDATIVLCDFGIARIADKDNVTTTGQLLGSPAYMAPEHIKGQRVDSRSDLFSLGTVLYELISGQLPFRGQNPHDTLVRIASGEHQPVSELAPLCSPALARVVERALSSDPAARPPEAELLRQDLEAALAESGIAEDEIRPQLRAYFQDPSAWEAAFAERLCRHLIAQGRAEQRAGRTALALSLWSRAQQIDPAHPDSAANQEIQALLGSVTRQRKRRRLLRAGAAVLAAGGILSLGTARLGPRLWASLRGAKSVAPPASGPDLAAVASGPAASLGLPLAPPLGGMPAAEAPLDAGWADAATLAALRLDAATGARGDTPGSENTSAAVPSEAAPRARPGSSPTASRPRPPEPIAVRMVRLEPWPKAVRVTHNGRVLGVYGTDVRSVQLAGGRNEFLFENPACYSEHVTLPAGFSPPEVRVRLRWKPALLLVRVTASGDAQPLIADVVVDGKLVGRSGQVVALPIQGDDSSRALDVQVSAAGHKSAVRSLTVRANQLSQIDVQLPSL